MEWFLYVIIIVFLVLIPVIVKFGTFDNIYVERTSYKPIDRRKMVSVCPVKLPFSVTIQNGGETNDCISVLIEGEKKCRVTFYICVHAKELQKVVEEKKITRERKLVDVLNLISLWITKPHHVCFSGEGPYIHNFSYDTLPLDVKEQLYDVMYDSTSQQNCIPLLVCIQLDDEESHTLVDDNNVVSIVSAISTTSSRGSPPPSRDSPPSHVLKYNITEQYIETLDARVFVLKKLYKSGVDHLDDESTTTTATSTEQPQTSNQQHTESSELCLVCQEHPVTRALLPCRHLCTCKLCFSKLDLCPICRQVITSYFVVSNEGEIPEMETTNQNNDDIGSLIQNEGIWNFIKSIWNAS